MLGMVMRLWLDSREKLMPDSKYEGLFGIASAFDYRSEKPKAVSNGRISLAAFFEDGSSPGAASCDFGGFVFRECL